MRLLFKICLCALFSRAYFCLDINKNEIAKNYSIQDKNSTDYFLDYRKCLLKEVTAKLIQLLSRNNKQTEETTMNPHYNVIDAPLKRNTRQNVLGLEKADTDWDKCVLRSELEEHKLLEQEHMVAIKDEVEKLRQLTRLLQNQQYLLNIMQNVDDKAKSMDVDEEEQLRHLLKTLLSNKGKPFDEHGNPLSQETTSRFKENTILKPTNISNIFMELQQLKKSITNLQKNQHEEKLMQEIENQKSELEDIREYIKKFQATSTTTPETTSESIESRQTEEKNEIDTLVEALQNLQDKVSRLKYKNINNSSTTNETSESILGVSLPKSKPRPPQNQAQKKRPPPPPLISRKAKTDDDEDIDSLLNILNSQKQESINKSQRKSKSIVNESHKKSSPSIPQERADNEDFLDDIQRLLDTPDSVNSDVDLGFNDDLENKLSGLQKQLEISSKIKKLEKKINQLHTAESKSIDDSDEHETLKNKIKKIEKQLKTLNNAEGRDLDEEDIVDQLKILQSDINKLRPKDDNEDSDASEGKNVAIDLALNKLFGKRKTITKTVSNHGLHLSPAQVQVLKRKIIAMRQGGAHGQAAGASSHGSLPYEAALSHYANFPYGPVYGDRYGNLKNNIYGGPASGVHYGNYGNNIYGGPASGVHYGNFENNIYGSIASQGNKAGYGPHSSSIGSYGPSSGSHGYGKYGSSYGSSNYNSDLANSLYSLLNTQYGSSGQYGGGGGGDLYGVGYGTGPSLYGSNTNLYEVGKNKYGAVSAPYSYSPQGGGATYGSGSSYYGPADSLYGLKSLYDKLYGSGNDIYGSANTNYGIPLYDKSISSYGSSGVSYESRPPYGIGYGSVPYGSKPPYGMGSSGASYGPNSPYGIGHDLYTYGSSSNKNDIGGYLYGSNNSPYSPVSQSYGNMPYGPLNNGYPYSSKNIYGNPYASGLSSVNSYSPLKNKPYAPTMAYNLDNSVASGYSSNKGQNNNQQYESNSQYGSSNVPEYSTGKGNQHLNADKNYGDNDNNQQYQNHPSYSNPNAHSYSPGTGKLQSNIYKDGNTATSGYKSQNSNPYLDVHNIFEHLAHGYEDSKPQFFRDYEKGHDSNSENYQSSASTNAQDSEPSYAYSSQNPTDANLYGQEKVQDLKTQIYRLQNVINNLSGPEYTQKPEDKETIYRLDQKITDLKSVVNHLSQDAPYSNNPSRPSAKRYRQSSTNLGLIDDNRLEENSQIDRKFSRTPRNKREVSQIRKIKHGPTQSQDGIRYILRQLGDLIDTIHFVKEELLNKPNSIFFYDSKLSRHTTNGNENTNSPSKQINKRETPESNNLENNKTKSKKTDALSNYLGQLSEVMEVLNYFSQGLSLANNNLAKNNNQDLDDKKFDETVTTKSKTRKIRQVGQLEESKDAADNILLKHLVNLINKISKLAQNVSKNNCTCVNGENCSHTKETIRERRQINENDEEDEDNDVNNGTQLFLNKISTFFTNVFSEANENNDINNVEQLKAQKSRQNPYVLTNQQQAQEHHQHLQQRLEELRKQLDLKLHTNINNQRLPLNQQNQRSPLYNNLYTSSSANPFYRSSYNPQQSYYPMYYPQPQYYYPEPTYGSKDKKEIIKVKKKKSKKDDALDKIFTKILDKIIDKVIIAVPRVINTLFGLEVEKILDYGKDDYGYGQGGYGKGDDYYAIQKNFKNMGLLGYIPLILLKVSSNLTYFVRQLQKNKFIRTFLVPALVTAGTAGLVVFLVWWLTDYQPEYGYSYGYSGKGGYGQSYGNYGNSGNNHRSNTIDNELQRKNSFDNRNNYYYDKRQNGFYENSDIINNEISKPKTLNDYYNQRNLKSYDNYR